MQERHTDREQYFREQSITTEKHVIPFINSVIPVHSGLKVLEIGCGEGGNLLPFLDMGCTVYGIDLAANKIENGREFFSKHPKLENLTLIASDIYKTEAGEDLRFDLIIMRDTLEHIPNQEFFLSYVKRFMKPEARLFLGFPPWHMPFGGHQQMCRNHFASKLPYIHLLPKVMYKRLLRLMGEDIRVIDELMEVRDTRINIQWFNKLIRMQHYIKEKEKFFLVNPNYEVKFNLKARGLPLLLNIPYIRDFFATTYYCVLSDKKSGKKNNIN
jgi:SAM-dependent methyltransferase